LERIVDEAPATLDAAQLRTFIELLLNLSPYGLFEEAAEHFVREEESHDRTDDEILTETVANCADDKLMGFALRLILSEHVGISREDQPLLESLGEPREIPPSIDAVPFGAFLVVALVVFPAFLVAILRNDVLFVVLREI
jgi:hypothetical protein